MNHMSVSDAQELVIKAVGLDPARYDCTEPEVLAALLRRAASFQCPCSGRALVRSVAESLRGLVTAEDLRTNIEEMLDELLAYGDLTEVERTPGEGRVVYTAPPSFVTLPSGRMLLLGVSPESVEWLPIALSTKITYRGHARSLSPSVGPTAGSLLKDAGYFEVPHNLWLHAPKRATPEQVYGKYVALLHENGHLAEPTGITILDPMQPVRYYKGRWKPATGTGCFVARREQRYGAPLWSFVKLADGRLVSLIDLPVTGMGWRACDEAWRLQAAIDARNGTLQHATVAPPPRDAQVQLRFVAPLPRWVKRQLDAIGESVTAQGALCAYTVPKTDLEFVRSFLAEHLWMALDPTNGDQKA